MSDRLADLICRSGKLLPPEHRERLARRPKVIADEISRMYWLGKPSWDFSDDTGPLRAPYPHFWVEWRVPIWGRNLEDGSTAASPMRQQGVAIHEVDSADDKFAAGGLWHVPPENPVRRGSRWLWFDPWFQTRDGRTVAATFYKHLVATDDDGFYVAHAIFLDPGARCFITPQQWQEAGPSSVVDIWPAVLAIGFMNCRNVTLTEPTPGTGRKRGRGEKPQKYRRIQVPGTPSGASTGDNTDPVAVHLVRGHFKTYTADAPLFGSQTGTWWWGHHVRGEGEHPHTPEYEVR